MKLVTVTCELDKKAMLLQAESIDKYLEPCTHWVIINETKPDLEQWRTLLSPYYNRHNLVLMSFDNYTGSGWHTQQSYKLLVGHYIDDDYLVLDSKNFFIRHCSIEEWRDRIGDGTVRQNKTQFIPASVRYSEKFNSPVLDKVLNMGTPFVIKHSVIKQYPVELIDWFNEQQDILNSEFILYSYMLKDFETNEIKWHHSWWKEDTVRYIDPPPHIKVLGIHREVQDKSIVEKLGFSNRL